MGFVFKSLCTKGTRLLHLCCPSICLSSYYNDFSTTDQLQHLEDDPISSRFKGNSRGSHKHLCPEQGKWWQRAAGDESDVGLAMHSSENPAASVTAPAQLLMSVRTQPPSVLVLKDMGAPSAPYRTHGGACVLSLKQPLLPGHCPFGVAQAFSLLK